MRIVNVAVLAVALWLALPATPVGALCTCSDVASCRSSLSCSGKTPGNVCVPPKNATCKIIHGNNLTPRSPALSGARAPAPQSYFDSCCCNCTPGGEPIGCDFTPVTDTLTGLKSIPACSNAKYARLSDLTVTHTLTLLAQATTRCEKGKSGAEGKVMAAERTLTRFKNTLNKLEGRGKISFECAVDGTVVIGDTVTFIDNIAKKGALPSTTTTTTTATSTTLRNCALIGQSCDVGRSCCGGGELDCVNGKCCAGDGVFCRSQDDCCPGLGLVCVSNGNQMECQSTVLPTTTTTMPPTPCTMVTLYVSKCANGTITSTPSGISCPTTCSATFSTSMSITLSVGAGETLGGDCDPDDGTVDVENARTPDCALTCNCSP